MPSLAVPDQSLTIDQLIKRYKRGQPLDGQKQPIYDDDESIHTSRGIHPKSLDLVEIQELQDEYQEIGLEYKKGVDSYNRSRKAQAEEEAKKKYAQDVEAAAKQLINPEQH